MKKPKEPTEKTRKKERDDGVIYGNQDIIKKIVKNAGKESKTGDMAEGTSKSEGSPKVRSASPLIARKTGTGASEVDKNETGSTGSPSVVRKKTSPAVKMNEAATGSVPSPKSKRISTPPVTSSIKPSLPSKPKIRPKTYVDGVKTSVGEGDNKGTESKGEPEKGTKKHEQLYQNVTFDDTQF